MGIINNPNFLYFESLIICILILILLFVANIRYWKPRIFNRLSLIHICITVGAIVHAIWCLIDGYDYDIASKILSAFYSIALMTTALFYFLFVLKLANRVFPVGKVWYIVAISLLGAMSLVQIISIWTGWAFYVDDTHHWHKGVIGSLFVGVSGIYVLGAVVFCIISASKVKLLSERYKFVTVSLAVIPCIVLTLVNYFVPYPDGLPILFFGVALSLLVLFISSSTGRVTRDPLTGLLNRFALDAMLLQTMKKNRNGQADLWLFVLDINGFKGINDTFGHPVGDDVLVQFAGILEKIGDQKNATVGRWGGDEFVLFFEGDEATAAQLAKNIKETVVRECNADKRFRVSVSIGYTKLREYQTMKHFFEEADHKLYEDKRRFHNLADRSKTNS